MIRILVVAILLIVAGCSDSEPRDEVTVDWPDITDDQYATAELALQRFFTACPDLKRYWSDVVSIDARLVQAGELDYLLERNGWQRYLVLQIRITDRLSTVPSRSRAAGHTLWYHLGGGDAPGVLGKKPQSRALCDGADAPSDADWFKRAPQLKIVDRL